MLHAPIVKWKNLLALIWADPLVELTRDLKLMVSEMEGGEREAGQRVAEVGCV
jgi:hypothetical protein